MMSVWGIMGGVAVDGVKVVDEEFLLDGGDGA